MAQRNMSWRDERAAAYTRSALNEGDTLVILHPNSYKPLDPAGFELNKILQVHSENLLRTGSRSFEKFLSPRVQRRIRKIHGYETELPAGIEYIIDLNPSNLNEDDAIDLVSKLSCSRGIRHWFTTETRCNIHPLLVGGRDATTAGANNSAAKLPMEAAEPEKKEQKEGDLSPDILKGFEKQQFPFLANVRDASKWSTSQSLAELNCKYGEFPIRKVEEVADYCPWRHRNGIEALLQCIEGKEPKLDSAPQVWTLAILAEYFDCRRAVVDKIVTWIAQGLDGFFVEVLPEASFQMGTCLQSNWITRDAFGILVSEAALRHGTSISPPIFKQDTSQGTRFLRTLDDVDEIEGVLCWKIVNAGITFYTRINSIWESLVDQHTPWFYNLPEFAKINRLRERTAATRFSVVDEAVISKFESSLRDYARGRIVQCLVQNLDYEQARQVNENRKMQTYLYPYDDQFENTYGDFTPQERIMTRFLWEHVAALEWDPNNDSLPILDRFTGAPRRTRILKDHNIGEISLTTLRDQQMRFNRGVLSDEILNPSTNDFSPQIPPDAEIEDSSPFFSLTEFMQQASTYVLHVAKQMLDKGEYQWAATTDTLLCFSEDEWRYLPQWGVEGDEIKSQVTKPEAEGESSIILDTTKTPEAAPALPQIPLRPKKEEASRGQQTVFIGSNVTIGPNVTIGAYDTATTSAVDETSELDETKYVAVEHSDEFDCLSDIEEIREQSEWTLVDRTLK
ncbi:hypothetical protein BGZ60DRAFT_436582 [Tricladium varicosporioides]|nr:hypothetical protein BGZ60DRAFT_436582 [Hymenoscyphus varicosporioides]